MLENDIKYLDKIMKIKNVDELKSNYFCWLYPFTNENINAYYKEINLENKKLLTVTSSGDHILNALLSGCVEIDAFDKNPLAKHYVNLKIEAIKVLDYEEFILFFYSKNNTLSKKYYLSEVLYNKFKDNLNVDTRMFWDYLFKNYKKTNIEKSFLFTDDYLNLNNLLKSNKYLDEKNYYMLQCIISNANIHFYDYSFLELSNLNKNYDVIILSNLLAFMDFNEENINKINYVLNSISNEDTVTVLCYLYGTIFTFANEGVYNKELIDSYFNNIKYKSFDSSDILFIPKPIRKILKKDSVIIQNKPFK